MNTVRLDFETFSELDIADVGPVVYANHPSTRILCMSWSVTDDIGLLVDRGQYREHQQDDTDRLFSYLPGAIVEAHNAMFERCIWRFIGQDALLWPSIDAGQWRCSAAKAAACALPRNLEDACDALELPIRKDMFGNRTMKRLTKPPKTKKAKPPTPEEFEILYAYCDNDVDAETGLSETLPDLTPFELEVWRVDQQMNTRGFPVDVTGAEKAIRLAEQWATLLNDELFILTDGKVERATQRERILAWLQDNGLKGIFDTQAATLDWHLRNRFTNVPGIIYRVLEIVRSIGRSSVTKYKTLVETAHDGRLHDTQMYCGAGTGRWTAKRFQPQNLVRGKIEDMDDAWSSINRDDLETVQMFYGDPFEFLSHAIRGAICAPDGYELYAADYNAVETRVIFWLSDEQKSLNVFRSPKPNEDIYTVTACDIYGRHITKSNKVEREVGKRATLGLGFGMGYVKFLMTCRTYNVAKFMTSQILEIMSKDELRETADYINRKDWTRCAALGMTLEDLPELALTNYIVRRYRARYKDTVVKMWTRIENAAKSAITNPGVPFETNKLRYLYDGERFLTCLLPSGRSIYYPFPLLTDGRLSHMDIDSQTKQWVRQETYGGKLSENAVQATARDVMASAIVRLDRHGVYELLMMVHDEIVSMARNGSVDEYEKIIAAVPDWAEGLPIKAEGWRGKRYKK